MSSLFAFGEFFDAVELAKQFGPFCLAVIFFLWRDWKREDRLTSRINTLEDETRHVLLPLIQECTRVITENTEAFRNLTKYLDEDEA